MTVLTVLLCVSLAVALAVAVWIDRAAPHRISSRIETAKAAAQVFGAAGLIGTLYYTGQGFQVSEGTLRLAQTQQASDRFSRDVRLLTDDNLGVRLGGIYSLQSLATSDERYQATVRRILAAFVHSRACVDTKLIVRTLEGGVVRTDYGERVELKDKPDLQAAVAWVGEVRRGASARLSVLSPCIWRDAVSVTWTSAMRISIGLTWRTLILSLQRCTAFRCEKQR